MSDTTTITYQEDQNRRRSIDAIRRLVERAILLGRKAQTLGRDIAAYDADENGFRNRAESERDAFTRKRIFYGTIILYILGELWASTDVAEFLANQMMPLVCGIPAQAAAASVTPVWLRLAAGLGFTGLMLGATLGFKFLINWFHRDARVARNRVAPGHHSRYWALTGIMGGCFVAKVVYLAAVATFYGWLFGFAQERATIVASIAATEQQIAVQPDFHLKLEDSPAATPKSQPAVSTATDRADAPRTSLANASLVVYCAMWLLHALVMFLPVHGIAGELPLRNFERGAVGERHERMRDEEERVLRSILDQINAASGEEREALILAVQPVREQMLRAARQETGSEFQAGATPADASGNPPDGGIAAEPAPADAVPAETTMGGSEKDPYETIFGSPGQATANNNATTTY